MEKPRHPVVHCPARVTVRSIGAPSTGIRVTWPIGLKASAASRIRTARGPARRPRARPRIRPIRPEQTRSAAAECVAGEQDRLSDGAAARARAAHRWNGAGDAVTVPFLTVGTTGGVMAHDEPMIVVFGTIGGGTSAVASVLHHLGVFMGAEFGASYRELQQNWEDAGDRPIVPQGRQCEERTASDGTSSVPGEAQNLGRWSSPRSPRPGRNARASNIPCCALRSICSTMPGARSCRWWSTGHLPRYWRL